MIRTFVTPQNTDLHLSIPADYVGKQIEVLLYTSEEVLEEKMKQNKSINLRGKLNLSDEQYRKFQQYVKDDRNQWDKNI